MSIYNFHRVDKSWRSSHIANDYGLNPKHIRLSAYQLQPVTLIFLIPSSDGVQHHWEVTRMWRNYNRRSHPCVHQDLHMLVIEHVQLPIQHLDSLVYHRYSSALSCVDMSVKYRLLLSCNVYCFWGLICETVDKNCKAKILLNSNLELYDYS